MSVTISGSGQIVKQVQSTTGTTQASTSSASFTTTGFSVTITPTNSANKILVSFQGGLMGVNGGQNIILTIYRGATNLGDASNGMASYYSSSSNMQAGGICGILDSPATTSAVTYTVYFKSTQGGTVYFNQNPTTISLTAMEIAYA